MSSRGFRGLGHDPAARPYTAARACITRLLRTAARITASWILLATCGSVLWWGVSPAASRLGAAEPEAFRCELLRQFPAEEAHQAVAVDAQYVYAIGSKSIGKYDKRTFSKLDSWQASDQLPLTHLNSGVVLGQRLYCAHSNYPDLPMRGSIEIWDTGNLKHVARHAFKDPPGSVTWIDSHADSWWVCFAHYDAPKGEPGKDNSASVLVKYNERWREQGRWKFPAQVLQKFSPYSASGGAWGPRSLLYCTGHDRAELYAFRIPPSDASPPQTELQLVRVVPTPSHGQGIAWDRDTPGLLYSVQRRKKAVFVSRLTNGEAE